VATNFVECRLDRWAAETAEAHADVNGQEDRLPVAV